MQPQIQALLRTFEIVFARVEHLLKYNDALQEIIPEIDSVRYEDAKLYHNRLNCHILQHRHLPSHYYDTPIFNTLIIIFEAWMWEHDWQRGRSIDDLYRQAGVEMADALWRANQETRASSKHFVWTTYSALLERLQ